jgi:hypothetical protein
MKKNEIKVGLRVKDTWYGDWGYGIIEAVLKTRVKIKFSNIGLVVYDYPHIRFLKIL